MTCRWSLIALLMLLAAPVHGAPGSGVFFESNASRGTMSGDTPKAGSDVAFQYAVRYAFSFGYEEFFSRHLSLRGAIGYRRATLNAYAARIPGYSHGDMTEVPFVSADVDRHWLDLPLEIKVALPIGRGSAYLTFGPKGAILLSSKYVDKLANTTGDLTSQTPRFNLAFGGRFGLEVAIGDVGCLFFESGYFKGLLNTSWISGKTTTEGDIVLLGLGFRMSSRPTL